MNKMYRFITVFIIILFFISVSLSAQPYSRSILLLIDSSGSMMGVKMDSVKSAAKQIINMLLPCNSEFAIMGFVGDKDNPVPYRLDFTTNKQDLYKFIDNLRPWGGTRIGAAIKTSSLYLKAHAVTTQTEKQIIILLSDGRSDDVVADAITELKERDAIIQTECIGYDLVKDKLAEDQLKKLANETGGEYYSATGASNVAKAFFKTSIKSIIHQVPVVVREYLKATDYKLDSKDIYKKLVSQNWFLDSVQINVTDSLYEIAQLITDENMQDTLPKSIVFDDAQKVSLFIDKATGSKGSQKWEEGRFVFSNNTLSITILQYYFKLVIKKLEKRSLVLCVNKFAFVEGGEKEPEQLVCDCSNKITNENPYILVYFSQAGCD